MEELYLCDFFGHSHGYFMLQYRIKKICSIYDKIDGWQHNDKIIDQLYPHAPCMVYLPTFTIQINQM